jgi:hypothetical protein
MGKEKLDRFVYFDDQGKAIGVGEELTMTDPVGGKLGGYTSQTVRATAGAFTERKQKVDDAVYRDINDPAKKLDLKDFKLAPKKPSDI